MPACMSACLLRKQTRNLLRKEELLFLLVVSNKVEKPLASSSYGMLYSALLEPRCKQACMHACQETLVCWIRSRLLLSCMLHRAGAPSYLLLFLTLLRPLAYRYQLP